MTLSKKLMLVCVLAGLLPTLIVALASNHYSGRMYDKIIDDSLTSFHNAIIAVVDLHLDGATEEARLIQSDLQELDSLDAARHPETAPLLEKTVNQDRDIDFVAVFDNAGALVWSAADTSLAYELDFQTLKDAPVTPERAAMAESLPGVIDLRFVAQITIGGGLAGKLVAGKFLFSGEFVDSLKTALGVEFSVICHDVRYATTLKDENGVSSAGTKVTNQEVLTNVLSNGDMYMRNSDVLGQNFNTLYWPVADVNKKIIGMLSIGESTVEIDKTQREFMISVLIILIVVLGIVLLCTKAVVGNISRSLTGIMSDLNHSFEQVNQCSEGILQSSETLSQGANEQATSLQDTAAALEEMMTMTKQSAENSNLTKDANIGTNNLIRDAVRLSGSMMEAMGQIETSARRIEAIIKTIDDIAFQTNLLALNAAVEGARAGDAGSGFAVVADEVRNLSLRSSEAARNTNDLISSSVDRVSFGVRIVNQLDDCFKKIEKGSGTVSELIDQISTATNEQARGAALAEQAVESASRVAERNAQEAGLTAKTSQSLSEAAQNLDGVIAHLGAIIRGPGADQTELLAFKK
ncbi:MAG: methyl-accepting chemotaxis protein [Deltaproteobacteria bacterium]|jgi:methyl-accepting chemotaxis protein|nr:methyl-accepting chemotaxis protein [Deltaproteobacteria bacterium]